MKIEIKQPFKSLEDVVVQLIRFLGDLKAEQYTAPLPVISGNSIGKHVRHILECMECLESGYDQNMVNYDERKRLEIYETQITKAQNRLLELLESIENREDKVLLFMGEYGPSLPEAEPINTTYFREIAYNLEHTIHHMAILRIASEISFPEIHIPEDFGIAYSTQRYLKMENISH